MVEKRKESKLINKADKKVGNIEHRKVRVVGVTKKDFHAILNKASQPIKHEAQSDSGDNKT
jgi:hypothetical protein